MKPNMLAAVAMLACGLGAQGHAKVAPSPAKAAYEKVVAEWKATTDAAATARKQVMESEAYKKAFAEKDREATAALLKEIPRPSAAALAKQAMETAGQFDGDDRVQFYVWAMQNGDKDVAKAAADKLLADHCKSKELLPVVESGHVLLRALGEEHGREFLAKIAAESPVNEIRANALFWPAYMSSRGRDVSAEAKEAAATQIAEARKLAEGTLLADRIDAPKFIQERLQIGMEAPDIAGEDVDGVPFKLSDYRGKVVVLDFWGFW